MSFYIAFLIMLSMGVLGGLVNFILPDNHDNAGSKIRSEYQCIALGIGATFLVPLFLEIAQSKLLDNMFFEYKMTNEQVYADSSRTDSLFIYFLRPDSSRKEIDTIIHKLTPGNSINESKLNTPKDSPTPAKGYFLFGAYCFLAAAAGFRFIGNITDSVLKDKQIAKLKEEKAISDEQKENLEKQNTKLSAQNKLAAKEDEAEALQNAPPLMPLKLGPIIHPEDPQKGRFGGKAENNGRKLNASVTGGPAFYNVKLWVESSDPQRPLDSDVIFYLHDSFRPSVYTIPVNEFVDGKAVDDEIKAWGAFTVGAITDDGRTLLELDLAEQENFPKEFRKR